MAFKRMDGFIGSIPQKFIDRSLRICPMCGSNKPHWNLDQKFGWVHRYLFKCTDCKCILSASTPDVEGESRMPFSTMGVAKMLSGKNITEVYFKVDEVGMAQTTKQHLNMEYGLEQLVSMGEKLK